MIGFKKVKTLLAGGLITSGLLLSACSGQSGSNGEGGSESSSEQESMEQPQSSSEDQEKPPQFNPNQQQGGGSDSISNEQLEQFSGAMDANRQIQQDMMPQMQKAVKDAGLSMQEYQNIDRKQRSGGQGMKGGSQSGSEEVSEEQLKKFNQAKKNLEPVQQEMRQKMEKAIKEEGMSMQQYRGILRKVRQDRQLQQRLRQMQQGGQQQGQQRQQPNR